MDAHKRGSDSRLQEKIKEKLNKPRSMQARAQSLDLTLSLSRIAEGASSIPPDSPTASLNDDFEPAPPSATAPSFPSVYTPVSTGAPHMRSGYMYNTGRDARILDDQSAEEVNRVISNLNNLGLE